MPTLCRHLLPLFLLAACALPLAAATYHVDGAAGDDARTGTAPDQAWRTLERVNRETFQPGDRILFKAGSRFSGQQLKPKGSGALVEGKIVPIVIDVYGTGDRPRIDGEGKFRDTVRLADVSFWELRGLEVTNLGPKRGEWRTGVRVVAEAGLVRHIRLANLFVHDVNGDLRKDKEGCGIFFESKGKKGFFDDFLVEKCRLLRTDRNGICQRSQGGPRSLNVVIRNNLLEDIGGDGIKPWGSNGALVEHNVIRGGRMRAEDAAAGIWPWACDDTLIQFNEVSGMKGTLDGQGFDSDYFCRRSVFQYNYSHDNEGGFILICGPGKSYCEDTVIRYNISQNDGINSARVFHFGGSSLRTQVYNNTIYLGPKQELPMIKCGVWDGGIPREFTFRNNLFLVEGRVTYDLAKGKKYLFESNAFIGTHEKRPPDAKAVMTKPPLVAPGSGKDGFASLNGYRLRPGQPAPKGVIVPNNGGRDFFGTPVPANQPPTIGATQAR